MSEYTEDFKKGVLFAATLAEHFGLDKHALANIKAEVGEPHYEEWLCSQPNCGEYHRRLVKP